MPIMQVVESQILRSSVLVRKRRYIGSAAQKTCDLGKVDCSMEQVTVGSDFRRGRTPALLPVCKTEAASA